jgi:hypothetical protein
MTAFTIRLISLSAICCGLVWVSGVAPAAVRDNVVLGAGQRIAKEESFLPQAQQRLRQAVDEIEPELACEVATRRAVASIRLREAEQSGTDAAVADFRASAQRLLRCSPREPLFWFALFWFDVAKTGIVPASYPRLLMSYELAPREGWIMRKRSRLLLPLLNTVPDNLKPPILEEFLALLQGGLVEDAVEAFKNSDPTVRERVLPSLVKLPEPTLAAFSRALREDGIEARVPGMPARELRPWSR